tara:strand:+ start:117 stop:1145 length:1029 start_codon:yes stop_codon:yes gene_type:complete
MTFNDNYKTQFITYLEDIRSDLSHQSRKLYAYQLNLILMNNNLNYFDPLKFITRLTNKAKRDKTLEFIILDGSNQTKNQRLSAVKSVLVANKDALDPKKYINLFNLINVLGDKLRYEISNNAGKNIKTEEEKEIFKITWNELGKFAENYKPKLTSKQGLRDYLMLNLMLNNYQEKDDIKYYVLLRVIEYSSLFLWTNKRLPPADKKNYIYLHDNSLYIQHSKTTGGIRRISNTIAEQKKVAKYPLSADLIIFIKLYIKKLKIKNKQPIFYNDKGLEQIDSNYFSKILKELLSPLNPNLNSTLLRKIYENRELPKNLNANQKLELNKNLDHSLQIAETFYKKI